MARILYVWELGDNYGHMSSFAAIAKQLSERGHDVFVALQNLSEAGRFFDGTKIQFLQAPLWRGKVAKSALRESPITYADVIKNYGFTHGDGLATLIQAWQNLYMMVSPDVALFNAPPVALLAARNQPFKKATFGTGYSIPPYATPLPNMRSWQKIPMEMLQSHEKDVLDVANDALLKCSMEPIPALCDMFSVDEDFLCTFKEFDHYPGRMNAHYYGAMYSLDTGKAPIWPEEGNKKVFAYIRPDSSHFIPLIRRLYESDACVLIVAPGVHEDIMRAFSSNAMKFSTEPLSIGTLRQECDAVICHAGHGTSAAFLMAGVPLMLFPNHLEQFMLSRHLLHTGAVMIPNPDIKHVPYDKMIADIVSIPHFKDAAEKLAFKYQDFSFENQCVAIIEKIEDLASDQTKTIKKSVI